LVKKIWNLSSAVMRRCSGFASWPFANFSALGASGASAGSGVESVTVATGSLSGVCWADDDVAARQTIATVNQLQTVCTLANTLTPCQLGGLAMQTGLSGRKN